MLALNTAVRRARGEYIGRIDQDTLVGEGFLRRFFEWHDGRSALQPPLHQAVLFANRRDIPSHFASQSPDLATVRRFVREFGERMRISRDNPWANNIFWTSFVGLLLAHRNLWYDCGGYDERLIYYNWMETDLICRWRTRYPVSDLGALTDYAFYHLGHSHPRRVATSERLHGKCNARVNPEAITAGTRPNGPNWGLAGETLPVAGA